MTRAWMDIELAIPPAKFKVTDRQTRSLINHVPLDNAYLMSKSV